MRWTLGLAAAYSFVWGGAVVLFPNAPFEWLGMTPPLYPEILQCVGMIVGVYGLAYAIAATNPLRHWPVVVAGLVGKVLGAIGFAWAAFRGRLPWEAGWTIVTNDLIWWVPFAAVLLAAGEYHIREGDAAPVLPRDRMMLRAMSQEGYSLFELSQLKPTLVVFLRHAGCTFCRETLGDLARLRKQIEERGVGIAFVTMVTEPNAEQVFAKYGLQDLPRISDPNGDLYRSFELRRGDWRTLFGPKTWTRGLQAGLLKGHGAGPVMGDPFRMPGVFLLQDGRVIRSYRHDSPADRPDYLEMAACAECDDREQDDDEPLESVA